MAQTDEHMIECPECGGEARTESLTTGGGRILAVCTECPWDGWTDDRPDSGERDWGSVAWVLVERIKSAAHEIVKGDHGEAYHHLYAALDPNFEVYGRGPMTEDVDVILDRLADRPSSTEAGEDAPVVWRWKYPGHAGWRYATDIELVPEEVRRATSVDEDKRFAPTLEALYRRPDPSTSSESACHVCSGHPDGQDGECGRCGRMIADAAPTENVLENQMEKRSNEHIADVLVALAGNQEKRMDGRYLCEAARRIRSGRGEGAVAYIQVEDDRIVGVEKVGDVPANGRYALVPAALDEEGGGG